MDSKSLNVFLQLSRNLHFGKTSQQVHMSPSTLSRTVRSLEQELGVSLFIRDNRSVELTHEGELLQRYAIDYFEEYDKLAASLSDREAQLSGSISIYCSVTAAHSFLYEVLKQFRLSNPGIEIVLHTGDTNDAIARVIDGHEDVAIAAKIDRQPSSLKFKLLGETPLMMIASKSHDIVAKLNPFDKTYWATVPMILPERGVFRERIDEWFAEIDFTPSIYAQVGGNEAIVSMVSLGYGVGLIPKIVVDNSPLIEQVAAVELNAAIPPVDVGFYTKARRLNNPLIAALWST